MGDPPAQQHDSAIRFYRAAVSRWSLIFLLAFAGGIAGLIVGEARPPVYQSTVLLRVSIDYERTYLMDENTQRHIFNRVRDLLLADKTLEAAVNFSADRGAASQLLAEFREDLRLEDAEGSWRLVASADTPEEAAIKANAWADSAIEQIDQALDHAWRAADLQKELYSAGCSLRLDPSIDAAPLWVCARGDPEAAEEIADQLRSEAQLSGGLVSALSYELLQVAQPADKPSDQSTEIAVLAGTLAGLFGGSAIAFLSGGNETLEG
jgi:capsular polysaccharide biosynthesis protein